MIRLVASDLDGTLLYPDGNLPEGIFDTIEALHAKGVLFVAASGRQHGNLRRLFAPVKDKIAFIAENGAIAQDGDQLWTVPIAEEWRSQIVNDLKAAGMLPMVSQPGSVFVEDTDRAFTDDLVYRLRNTLTVVDDVAQLEGEVIKISGYHRDGVAPLCGEMMKKWGGKLNCAVAGHRWFDLTCANKATGLEKIMTSRGIRPEEAAAFGDQFNDAPMLAAVGHAYVMAHADDALCLPGYQRCQRVLPILQQIV